MMFPVVNWEKDAGYDASFCGEMLGLRV